MDNRFVRVLAHPTGRLLFQREPYALDMGRVIGHAKQRHCALELNAQPDRLDLNDGHCMMARDEGALVVIDADAHAIADFDDLRFGIGQARRGWLEKKHVLNTRTVAQLRTWLSK
jgi:DNA polymerase (family 10)